MRILDLWRVEGNVIMLGMLLLAGLGLAASAIFDHGDDHHAEDDHLDDDDSATSDGSGDAHGSLLDDPEPQHGAHEPQAHGHSHHHATDVTQQDDTQQDEADASGCKSSESVSHKYFGTEADDTLKGSKHGDLMEGNGGDDLLQGRAGADHLVSFDEGQDTISGGAGADSLHGYTFQHLPDDTSFMIEDHAADELHGGGGKDVLFLGSDDVGSGGNNADAFHVSWDVEQDHPATITDYNSAQDKIFVEYASYHADENMTPITDAETTVTTAPLVDGSGTAIFLNGHAIAHVMGTTTLQASDIGLISS